MLNEPTGKATGGCGESRFATVKAPLVRLIATESLVKGD